MYVYSFFLLLGSGRIIAAKVFVDFSVAIWLFTHGLLLIDLLVLHIMFLCLDLSEANFLMYHQANYSS